MIKFKSYEDLAYEEFYSCHILGCELESEKIYAAETKIVDVCLIHYKELTEKECQ
jgi:hypothetical protein